MCKHLLLQHLYIICILTSLSKGTANEPCPQKIDLNAGIGKVEYGVLTCFQFDSGNSSWLQKPSFESKIIACSIYQTILKAKSSNLSKSYPDNSYCTKLYRNLGSISNMDEVKIITFNAKGLQGNRKRRKVFHWLKKKQAHLYFLQETH